MPRSFRRLVDALPWERRERVEGEAQRLTVEHALLKALGWTQNVSPEELADLLVARLAGATESEGLGDVRLSVFRRYVEVLGGELEVRVRFAEGVVRLDPFLVGSDEPA